MASRVNCEICNAVGRRRRAAISPEGWYFGEVYSEESHDIVIVLACSAACKEAFWKTDDEGRVCGDVVVDNGFDNGSEGALCDEHDDCRENETLAASCKAERIRIYNGRWWFWVLGPGRLDLTSGGPSQPYEVTLKALEAMKTMEI